MIKHKSSEHPKQHPDNPNHSIDVFTVDEDGLINIAFYDFESEEWVFLSDYDKSLNFVWMEKPTKFEYQD